jgi:hypothetical protein
MDYPGNLGYWHRGMYVLGIHADWPAYPGRGLETPSMSFVSFRAGPRFGRSTTSISAPSS